MRAVNLIPADQQPGRVNVSGRSEGGAFIVIGVVAALAVLAFVYGSARHQAASRESEATSLTARAQVAEAQANKLTPYTTFISLHQQRENEVSQLIGERFDWAHAYHEFARVLPSYVTLTSVQGTVGASSSSSTSPAPAPTSSASTSSEGSVTPPGSTPTFTLAGCTNSQSEVAYTIERLRQIDGVSEVQLGSSAKSAGSSGGGAKSAPVSSASSGPCSSGGPTFTMSVTFAGLPTPTAPSQSSSTTSTGLDSSSGGNR